MNKFKKVLFILPAIALLGAACNNKVAVQTPDTSANPSYNQDKDLNKDNEADNNEDENTNGNSQKVTMVKITLNPQNNSGESGSVTITEVQGKAKVVVNLTGAPTTVVQPAHIHFGSCAQLGDVRYPLTSVSKGASQTTLSVSLAELIAQPFAINVHKSAQESGVYVACGDSLRMNKTTE